MRREEIEAVAVVGGEPARALVLSLLDQADRHQREVARLEARVARLEEQTRSSSRNSSKPPSQDPPKTRKERRAEARARAKEWAKADREGAARGAGGQPGHRGSGRKLAPEDQVDEIVDHYPSSCGGCGHEFASSEQLPSRRPARHQVSELPQIAVSVTEHRSHRLRCPHCKAKTRGVLPGELAGSAFGPDLQAAVVTMTARNRVSRRDMSELARDVFGISLSVGSVDAICQRASQVLAEPHEALLAAVLDSPALNVDETGWSTAGEGRTLWTATTPEAAIFRIACDRHRDRLDQLIGGYPGIVCSDRWWAYDHLDPDCRQACWQHLKRDFTRHSEGLAEQKLFGEAGLALTGQLFEVWHAFYKPRPNRPTATGERVARFARTDCEPCPLRARCAPGGRRDVRISRREDLRQAALKALSDPVERDHLKRTRPRIERLLGLLVHRYKARTSRYLGSRKATFQALWTAVLVNLHPIAAALRAQVA